MSSNKAPVNPKNFTYRELLVSRAAYELRGVAKAARIDLPLRMKKQEMLDYLVQRIPDKLPELLKRLSKPELLLCEIVASAGGLLPLSEARLLLETEIKRRRAKEEKKKEFSSGSDRDVGTPRDDTLLDHDPMKKNRGPLEDGFIASQVYGMWQYRWGDPAPVDLILFSRGLYGDAYDRFYGYAECFLMPKEARKYFEENLPQRKGSGLLVESDSSKFEALSCVGLSDFLYHLLDGISRAASSKRKKILRASPTLGRLPKTLVFPILQKYLAPTRVFQEVVYSRFLEWYEVNAIISEFVRFTKLLEEDGRKADDDDEEESGLKVSTSQDVLALLASERKLCTTFLKWWAGTENPTRVIRRQLFDLEQGVGESEVVAKGIISKIVRNDMKPGKWYSAESIVERVRMDKSGYNFDHAGIGRRGPQGTMADACEEICKTMIACPLLLFGILETNGPEMEFVRLGRWASSAAATRGSDIDKNSIGSSKNNKSIVVTPNFEIILQHESRTFSFQLGQFCENTNSEGPAIILRITKSSVLKAFRRSNHTLEQIIAFFRNLSVELPDNVIHELNEWGRRYGEVELRTAEILECRDEALAATLATDPAMKKHIVRRVGSTTLEVKPGSESEILSRCDSIGLLAKG